MKPAKQCIDVQKNVCKMVPQPDICKEVPIKPFEVCQPTKSCAEGTEIEVCTVDYLNFKERKRALKVFIYQFIES